MSKTKRRKVVLIFLILGIVLIILSSKILGLVIQDVIYFNMTIICIELCIIIPIVISIDDEKIYKINGIYKTSYIKSDCWLKCNIIWLIVNFWIIGSSFLANLIIIYTVVNEINKNRIVFYSIMSLFTSIMSYVLNPIAMAKGYRLAFQEIDKAILIYENGKCENDDILVVALIKGEEYISKYSYEMKS